MKTIYVDTLFLINGIINYLLLLTAAQLSGYPYRRFRLVLAALFGGVYAVVCLFPATLFFSGVLFRVLSGALMVAIAFGEHPLRVFLRRCVLFFIVSFLFGGGVLALYIATGRELFLQGGSIYVPVSVKTLLIATGICYAIVSLFLRGSFRHGKKDGEIVAVSLELEGKTCTFQALRDTGNTLCDPLTNHPVLVAEASAVLPLFSGDARKILASNALNDAPGALEKLAGAGEGRRFRLLPYRAVGTESGMLLAFRPDRAEVAGKPVPALLVALSPSELSEGAGYSALAGVL
ncbi:sigma-E processing peptidase SpoIIGA [Oscillospiraceae bacterium OttesenSCG-928-G22]|nr:sigma-E processing peptidase SpoIIGA [Oscillospiraceae bacterium OttesenSCG-928-G22]